MGNTGKKIILSLKEVAQGTNVPTGRTTPNDPNNPAISAFYVAPYIDTTACPITFDTAAPSKILADWQTYSFVYFEFSLPDSSINNPNVNTIEVNLYNANTATLLQTLTFSKPFTNYFGGQMTNPSTGYYDWNVKYLNGAGATLASHVHLSSFTI